MKPSFQYRYLWPIVLGLLLLNLGLLGWIWLSPQNHVRSGETPARFLERELNFTEEQKKRFRLLREDHHASVQGVRDSVRQMKKQFFAHLGEPMTDDDIANKTSEIARQMALVDKITFQHFRQVRQMCTPAQQQKFDSIIDEMLRRLAAGAEGRGGPPPDGGPPPHEHPPHDGPPPGN